ncbi:DUF3261 domain-containing protein [Gallaecimonas sp. GXIMD4217]|uniref:DUF3261 domain-containing protein n=1 Tax=Gallaecimonas sp. GXIMD4217 TaxID=3131927 RepID=UPI00311B393F
MRQLLLTALLLLAGCQLAPKGLDNRVMVANGAEITLPALDWVEEPSSQQHQVLARFGDSHWQFIGELVLERQQFRLTAVSALGAWLFSGRYDGRQFSIARSPLLPQQARPRYLMADLLLALMPTGRLAPILAEAGLRLEADGQSRRIYQGEHLVIEITQSAQGLGFVHHQRRYSFQVSYG